MNFLLPLPEHPGLALGDLALRLYRDLGSYPQGLAGVTLADLSGAGDYWLAGLPDEAGAAEFCLTAAVAGMGISYVWPELSGSPLAVVIPDRRAGLAAGDLALRAYRDGVAWTGSLVLEELGSPGDYAASGWPVNLARRTWVLVWSVGGAAYTRGWTEVPATPSPTPETIARRLLGRKWLDFWLGPSGNSRTYCAAGVAGVDFDEDNALDTAPFTPEEVHQEVGFVRLTFIEIDSYAAGVGSGVEGSSGAFIQEVETLLNLQFEIRVPASSDLARDELYRAAIQECFLGFSTRFAGPPLVVLRQPMQYLPRRRSGIDDGSWRQSFIDVKVLVRERRALAGAQGVSLP